MGNWEFRANPVFYWKVWQWFHHEDGRGVEMFHFVSREKSKFVVCALSENKNQYLQFCPKAFMGGGGLSSLLGMPGRTPRNRIEKMWLFKCEGKAKTRNNALKHILNNFVCQHFSFCWQHLMLMYWCTKIVCWLFLCCFFVLRSNRSCATGGASSIATPEMLQPNPGVREVAVLFPAGSGFLFTLLASLCSRHHIQTYFNWTLPYVLLDIIWLIRHAGTARPHVAPARVSKSMGWSSQITREWERWWFFLDGCNCCNVLIFGLHKFAGWGPELQYCNTAFLVRAKIIKDFLESMHRVAAPAHFSHKKRFVFVTLRLLDLYIYISGFESNDILVGLRQARETSWCLAQGPWFDSSAWTLSHRNIKRKCFSEVPIFLDMPVFNMAMLRTRYLPWRRCIGICAVQSWGQSLQEWWIRGN